MLFSETQIHRRCLCLQNIRNLGPCKNAVLIHQVRKDSEQLCPRCVCWVRCSGTERCVHITQEICHVPQDILLRRFQELLCLVRTLQVEHLEQTED